MSPDTATNPVERYFVRLQDRARRTIKTQISESDKWPLRDRIDEVLQSNPFPEGRIVEDMGNGSLFHTITIKGLEYPYNVTYRVDKEQQKVMVIFIEVIRFQ